MQLHKIEKNGYDFMKKIITPVLAFLFTFVIVVPTFASENSEQNLEALTENKGEVTFVDDEITITDFGDNPEISDAIFNHPDSVVSDASFGVNGLGITPYSSVTGPGGRASIVAGDSGRILYWSVKPATAWPFHFSGLVKLRYHSGFSRDAVIGSMGILGQTVSGSVGMNRNNGGVAYLSGTAYAITREKFKVLPGVHTSF